MISTVVTISCLRLWNNKQEVILLVALPILFFSIFAFIFSSGVGSNGTRVTVAYVDDDHSSLTQSVVRSTAQQRGIKVVRDLGRTSPDWPIQRLAKYLIASEDANFVVHFPEGFTDQLAHPDALPIRILDEGTNAVGQQIIEAILVQAVAQNSIPAPSDAQGVIFASTNRPLIETGAHTQHLSSPMTSQVSFASGNAFAENKHNPKIAMYAAGIAIMFLLFSANGAGGSLLEEKEAGTLERILGSRLNISQLFIGKWLYITGMGVLQLVIMFAWGQLVFGIDFTGHLAGFALLALPTSGAAASFALLLAALCKSRSQLNGVSVVLVLSMSALGGSMIPRYIMSESMQRLGRLTFNGWALDGFQKIFWYDLPVSAVRLEVCVLCCIAGVLGIAARLLATRWSTL